MSCSALRRKSANAFFARKAGSKNTNSTSVIPSDRHVRLSKTQRKNRNRRARQAELKISAPQEIDTAVAVAVEEAPVVEEFIAPVNKSDIALDVQMSLFIYDGAIGATPMSYKDKLLTMNCADDHLLIKSVQNYPKLVHHVPSRPSVGIPKPTYKTVVLRQPSVAAPLHAIAEEEVEELEPMLTKPIELVIQKPAGVVTPWVYKKLEIPDIHKKVTPRVIFLDDENLISTADEPELPREILFSPQLSSTSSDASSIEPIYDDFDIAIDEEEDSEEEDDEAESFYVYDNEDYEDYDYPETNLNDILALVVVLVLFMVVVGIPLLSYQSSTLLDGEGPTNVELATAATCFFI